MAAREMEGETDVGSSERRRRGMLVLEARGYIIRKGERKGPVDFCVIVVVEPLLGHGRSPGKTRGGRYFDRTVG